MKVDLTVNGKDITADVEDRMLLVHFLRDVADLTATNVGCDTTSCGACTVLFDGESVKSCTVLAAQASGHEVTTVEGLATNGEMHPVQRAFHTEHGLQCGFCTPGMVMAIVSMLKENPHPTEEQVRRAWKATCAGAPAITTSSGPRWPPRAKGLRGGAGVIPSSFTYKRAGSADRSSGPGRRTRRGREVPGRRSLAAAADEAAAGRPGGDHRPGRPA